MISWRQNLFFLFVCFSANELSLHLLLLMHSMQGMRVVDWQKANVFPCNLKFVSQTWGVSGWSRTDELWFNWEGMLHCAITESIVSLSSEYLRTVYVASIISLDCNSYGVCTVMFLSRWTSILIFNRNVTTSSIRLYIGFSSIALRFHFFFSGFCQYIFLCWFVLLALSLV